MKSIYAILFLSEFVTGMVYTLFAFLFFSANSSLFPSDLSQADRAVVFGGFLALFKLAGIICNPLFGCISDVIGRKGTTLIALFGILIFGCFSIIAFLLHNVWIFIIGAIIHALLFATKPVCSATINDRYSDNVIKNQALVQFWIGLGVSIGPIVGGFIGGIEIKGIYYLLPFIVLLLGSVYLILHTSVFMKETLHKAERSRLKEQFSFDAIRKILKSKVFVALLVIHLLNQLSWGNYYDFIPAVAKIVFRYDVKLTSIVVGLIGISLLVVSGFLIPIISNRVGAKKLIAWSCIAGTIGVSIAYASSFFPDTIFGNVLFWFSTIPTAGGDVVLFCFLVSVFSNACEKKYQGAIIGFLYITGTAMWSLSAPLGGFLMKYGANSCLIISPISMIILLLFLVFIYKKPFYQKFGISK